jgi:nicotinamidase/pyrazinamidase
LRALILVDLQNDFFPGGALPVREAHAIFPLANEIQDHFHLIIASKDWHPSNHGSFASNHPCHKTHEIVDLNGLPQILWPDHCVQNTLGSEFHPKLRTDKIHKIFYKGTDPTIDSYSTFFDNAHRKTTGLGDYLREQEIQEVYIMGLATDYCVLYSVLDARKLGFKTYVIQDGCFGIEEKPGDIEKAFQEMKNSGATIIKSEELTREKA